MEVVPGSDDVLLGAVNGIMLWDTQNQTMRAYLSYHRLELPIGNVFDTGVSPDGSVVALATPQGLWLWTPSAGGDLYSVKDLTRVTPPVYRIGWALGGSALVLADYDGGLYLFDMATQCVTHVFSAPVGMPGANLVRRMVPEGYNGPRRPQRAPAP